LEDKGYDIEFVEQPVKAFDIEGLKFVTDNVETDILADEAVFGPLEAIKIVSMRAADLINIKLMKCGGIYNALKIINIAESCGIECMMGCMLESKIGISAASSFAAGKKGITKADLDTVMLFSEDPIVGGVKCENNIITLTDEAGLGITDVIGWKELH
ncbi:MAG: enolase C-terminal domain-like protein, partial [Bacillota bacterium]|nr:enolase C-terminal domain-like protein [Bacillota bacterium]